MHYLTNTSHMVYRNERNIIPYIFSFVLFLGIFDGLIYLNTGINFVDSLSVIFIFYSLILIVFLLGRDLIIIPVSIFKIISLFFIFLVLVFVFNNVITHPNLFYPYSFFYQAFKLGLMLLFLPLLFFSDDIVEKTIKMATIIFLAFVILNIIFLIVQLIFGYDVYKFLFVTTEYIKFKKIHRPAGITAGVNILAECSLFIMIIFIFLKSKFDSFKNIPGVYLKYFKFIIFGSFFLVVASTSRSALFMIMFLPVFFMKKNKINIAITFIVFIVVTNLIIYANIYQIQDKLDGYIHLATNFEDPDYSLLEYRAQMIHTGTYIFINRVPFGAGLGTWGDFSASFNPYADNIPEGRSQMSDSYFFHMLAEQGVFILIYLYIIFMLLRHNTYSRYMLFCVIVNFFSSMAFSASTHPFVIAFGIMIFNYKKFNGK